ncbi:MAG: response regulator [Saprospiraceae bacterium]|nr:response regulator [Saprospiraceae bacterium]
MKVLIVDDERDIKRLFEQRFRREIKSGQIRFHFAFSGKEALDYLSQGGDSDLTLILSDINMPNMNGFELLKRIKSDFKHLIVYMITAYGDDDNKKQAIELGATDYLLKPINFRELKNKLFT